MQDGIKTRDKQNFVYCFLNHVLKGHNYIPVKNELRTIKTKTQSKEAGRKAGRKDGQKEG